MFAGLGAEFANWGETQGVGEGCGGIDQQSKAQEILPDSAVDKT